MAWRSSSVKEVIVYVSTSHSVWANLAFEDWIFHNVDLSFRRILFLWRNTPCVVIGRHQNPWLECNVRLLRERGVALARRRSGGGTVYHDLGNLNVTLFAHRSDYDRPRNLRLVTSALNERWNTQLSVNQHNDIICRHRWKVSGSSSKLAKSSTYHHFTLLLNADTTHLHQYLTPHPELKVTESTATQSRRSDVINLQSLHPSLSHDSVCSAISEKFYDLHAVTENRKVLSVDPRSEATLPGITDFTKDLQKWEWNYGKTPKFICTAQKDFKFGTIDARIDVVNGTVDSLSTVLHSNPEPEDKSLQQRLLQIQRSFKGYRLCGSAIPPVVIQNTEDSKINEIVSWLHTLLF